MEATMIMIDNSESSINGDHPPTRWDQEVEAANLLIEGKLADSPQASVGLGIMAGKRV
jgi:26S proteasome regulatory subunit N10